MYIDTQNTYMHKNESKHSEMGPVNKTQSTELLSLFICVCIALCTVIAHNPAQNRPDNFPSYPPDNHRCSDDVYLREGGTQMAVFPFSVQYLQSSLFSATSILCKNDEIIAIWQHLGNFCHIFTLRRCRNDCLWASCQNSDIPIS